MQSDICLYSILWRDTDINMPRYQILCIRYFVFDTLKGPEILRTAKFLVDRPNMAPGPWGAIAEFPLPKIVVYVNRFGIICVRSLTSMVQNCVYLYPCDTKLNGQLKEGAISVGEFCRKAENVIIKYKWIQSANGLWTCGVHQKIGLFYEWTRMNGKQRLTVHLISDVSLSR